ncbi:MAG: trypsin-like peptidase domain-containing protein [Deltaproteobacteria bacterium]|nr:trypsin-like peptidase domain-containing protein [Deltaproteobacteria bacterium]
MRRGLCFAVVMLAACDGAKTPEEAATLGDVQVTDGFKYAGGVVLTDQHVLTQGAIVKGVEDTSVLDGAAKGHRARVTSRSADLNLAVLYIETGGLQKPAFADSAALAEGAALTAQVFDPQGKASLKTAVFKAWRNHEGRAYLETDFDTPDIATGAGVFGPDGKLCGVLSFKLGTKLTYVLPIEYATHGPKSLTAQIFREKKDSPGFAAKRAEAEQHPEPMPTPKSFDKIDEFEYSFSKTAIVGWMRILDRKGAASHAQPLRYKVEAVNEAQAKRVLAEGHLEASQVKWVAQADEMANLVKNMGAGFGAAWVKENLEPYEYGEVRWRLPISVFCPKVTDKEVHVVNLTLPDGRAPQPMGFNDMVNICGGQEDADGGAWEREWGFPVEVAKAPAAPKKPSKPKKRGRRGR